MITVILCTKYCRHVFTHIKLLTLLCSWFLTEEGMGFKLRKHRQWQNSQEPSHSLRDRQQLLSLEEWPASWAGGSRDAFEKWYPCCCLEVTHALVNSPDTWIIKLDVWGLLLWSVPCPVGIFTSPRSIPQQTWEVILSPVKCSDGASCGAAWLQSQQCLLITAGPGFQAPVSKTKPNQVKSSSDSLHRTEKEKKIL